MGRAARATRFNRLRRGGGAARDGSRTGNGSSTSGRATDPRGYRGRARVSREPRENLRRVSGGWFLGTSGQFPLGAVNHFRRVLICGQGGSPRYNQNTTVESREVLSSWTTSRTGVEHMPARVRAVRGVSSVMNSSWMVTHLHRFSARIRQRCGRRIPSAFIRELRVDGFRPSRRAAPC